MLVHGLVARSMQKKEYLSARIMECHREVVLLRDRIKGLKRIADEKIQEELKKHSLYQTLNKTNDDLRHSQKDLEKQFSHWYYVYDESVEGWDCDCYDSDTEKFLRPLCEQISASENVCSSLMNRIYEEIRQKYYNKIDEETHALQKLEKKEKRLQEMDKECYDAMCEVLDPLLSAYIPIINKVFKKLGTPTDDLTPMIRPELLEKGGWKLSFLYDLPISHTENIDEEEFDESGEIAEDGLIKAIEKFEDGLNELCEDSIPSLVGVNVEYDGGAIDIDGHTYYHKGYYDSDTGYGEPEGDFYYGDVTASTTLSVEITIM